VSLIEDIAVRRAAEQLAGNRRPLDPGCRHEGVARADDPEADAMLLRLPRNVGDRLRSLREATGRRQVDLLREAVVDLLAKYGRAG